MAQISGKYTLLFLVVGPVLLAGVAIVLLCIPAVRIDQSSCDQIRPGMTVSEAETIIGGPSGWYDGVWGIRTDAPSSKEYKRFWIGERGEIVLDLDAHGSVAEARFYPGQVLDRSLSKFVWERLTRNAFGTGQTDLVVAAAQGVSFGIPVSGLLVVFALSLRKNGWTRCGKGLCLFGAIGFLALLVFCAGVSWGTYAPRGFQWIGASLSGLILSTLGCILCDRRKKPNQTLQPTGHANDGSSC
jgi:hypothetical protein